jgi:hypothetical protein
VIAAKKQMKIHQHDITPRRKEQNGKIAPEKHNTRSRIEEEKSNVFHFRTKKSYEINAQPQVLLNGKAPSLVTE